MMNDLYPESEENVVKLKFQSHSSVAGFTQLEIAFGTNGLIRRVTGSTINKTIVMDYLDVKVNQDLPDARFEYESPVHANVYRDFLFEGID